MQTLDLSGGRRRIGGGEDVSDPVVEADAVEQHVGGLASQPAGEDLAVVGQDLLRYAVAIESLEERIAHRSRGRSRDDLCHHTET